MKLGYIKLLLIEFILFISLLFRNFVYSNNIYTIIFLSIILFSLIFLIGYEKDKSLFKTDIIQSIVIYCIIYYLFIYLFGLSTGFLKNSYNLSFLSILKNTIPYIIIITLLELIRYIYITKSKEKKYIIVLITILISLIDIILMHGSYGFESYKSSFYLISLYVLPTLAKDMFLSFITYHYGYKPSLVYRFIVEVPLFFLPILPNFGKYLDSIIRILLPAIIYFKISNTFFKQKKSFLLKNYRFITNTIFIFFCLIVVYLTCGLFKYYALAVGSGSMNPNVNLGDVVIVEKVKQDKLNTLKVGDILVFTHDGKTIVHRIVAIKKYHNKLVFRTKGDHNEESDNYDISSSDVIGKVNFKLSYIGYPVIWINKLF